MRVKYITFTDTGRLAPVLFPEGVPHVAVRQWLRRLPAPVSAGFARRLTAFSLQAYGASDGLALRPLDGDSVLLTEALEGRRGVLYYLMVELTEAGPLPVVTTLSMVQLGQGAGVRVVSGGILVPYPRGRASLGLAPAMLEGGRMLEPAVEDVDVIRVWLRDVLEAPAPAPAVGTPL